MTKSHDRGAAGRSEPTTTHDSSLLARTTALALLLAAGSLSGCAIQQATGPVGDVEPGQATLLVADADGSVQEHSADVDADVCLRSIPLQMTVCYAKGPPRVDPDTSKVTGHHMVMTRFETH